MMNDSANKLNLQLQVSVLSRN